MRIAPQSRRGFTLMEVTLVMALMVILAAIAVPSMQALYGDIRLSAASDLVRARFADARSHAMEEGTSYRFAVQPDSTKFRLAPDTGDHWSDGIGSTLLLEESVQPLVLEGDLPEGVTFQFDDTGTAPQGNSDGWTKLGTFVPDGTCREDISIIFKTKGQNPLRLKLRGLTGSVRVETIREEK